MSGCVRVLNNNYIDLAENRDASSEKLLFPDENLYDSNKRTKAWRSDGFWDITESNNTLVFAEGGGDLTATLTAQEYNSTTDLLTEIKTQLEDAGALTYTITYLADITIK